MATVEEPQAPPLQTLPPRLLQSSPQPVPLPVPPSLVFSFASPFCLPSGPILMFGPSLSLKYILFFHKLWAFHLLSAAKPSQSIPFTHSTFPHFTPHAHAPMPHLSHSFSVPSPFHLVHPLVALSSFPQHVLLTAVSCFM